MTKRIFAPAFLRAAAPALALAAATCTPTHPALAESEAPPARCAAYPEMVETLRRRFGETLRLHAEESRGFALEFFAHPDGSWTLVMRRDDQACAIAAGEAWRAEPQGAF
jgi:hypothetical protein